jgi:type VI secretion system Hcp family effector
MAIEKETAKTHLEAFMAIKGTKQGTIKGESYRKGQEGKLRLLDFEMAAVAPRDLATGQASGKRQHQPFSFTTEVGSSTPQLMQACVTNEVLKTVDVSVYKHDAAGQEQEYLKLHFDDATVSKYEITGNHPDSEVPLVKFQITFRAVEVDAGKVVMQDQWTTHA